MSKAIVQFDDVVAEYQKKAVLGPISMHIHHGDFWGIVGPNGAGKSTLLRALVGLQPLTSGKISVLGDLVKLNSSHFQRTIRKRIGLLLQHHDFYPDLPITIEDVVSFGRTGLRGLGRRYNEDDYKAINDALDELGLEHVRTKLYRELSGGEKRKVHLARMMAQKAEIMLLDEPTAGLDLDWQERLTCLVENLYNRHGKTIIMVTHDVDRLPSCCNKILLIKKGRQMAKGSPAEIFRKDVLSPLYGCNIEVREHNGRYHVYSLGLQE